MLQLEGKVAAFISSQDLLGRADRVLLAVSGGADSTALMYAMCALKAKGVIAAELLCCHINHQLRGAEADLDEEFVLGMAAKLELPITTRRADVRLFAEQNKLSIETAGRKLRMQALLEVARDIGCKCVATAHQKNDNAETLVQRLLRGTGFRGLCGIWSARTFGEGIRFVRPLLCVARDEVIEYLRARNLRWRVDHTNLDCTFKRNFIRHRLLPALQADSRGSVLEQLSELAQAALRLHGLVSSSAERAWAESADCSDDSVVLDVKKLSPEHPAVKVELARCSLTQIGSGQGDLTQQHYERMLQLAQQNISGRQIVLPNGFMVRREYGRLIFSRARKETRTLPEKAESIELTVPGMTRFGTYLIEASFVEADKDDFAGRKTDSCLPRNEAEGKTNFVERFDSDKLKTPLLIRTRQAGDRFWPLGLAGDKKVGKFLTSAKAPQELRDRILIVADSEKIIWVCPIRMSEQVKVDSGTRNILQLRITDEHSPNRQK
ncbi:MAG TPA: tRNA lysidine(34) synthetase TilS [Sedimentisphaerales bacterium]|nr:tRNA lysidine(34) synthetase TilS [Sedimentisphaerales bacterium]